MPDRPPRIPAYRLHKPTGQAVVRLDGKDHYLGKHGSPASQEKYRRLVAERLAAGRRPPDATPGAPRAGCLRVSDLILSLLASRRGLLPGARRLPRPRAGEHPGRPPAAAPALRGCRRRGLRPEVPPRRPGRAGPRRSVAGRDQRPDRPHPPRLQVGRRRGAAAPGGPRGPPGGPRAAPGPDRGARGRGDPDPCRSSTSRRRCPTCRASSRRWCTCNSTPAAAPARCWPCAAATSRPATRTGPIAPRRTRPRGGAASG
jgi:hypothetical protein